LIRDYVERYGFQAWVFRFGNVIGGVMSNGVIRDLVLRLKEFPKQLEVLGSKKPSRPFFTVDDCVAAIMHGFDNSNESYQVFNIAGSGSVNVGQLVGILLKAVGRENLPVVYSVGEDPERGWTGSAIEVCIDPTKLRELGWEAQTSPKAAVKRACREILDFHGVSDE